MFKIQFLNQLFQRPERRRRVDACLFHNEVDLLTIRIEELWEQIDYFVVVEANETFSGKRKPLFFREHRSHFQQYSEKLTYRSITDLPDLRTQTEQARFAREAAQRNAINAAVDSLPLLPKDIVVVSDVDEIPRANRLADIEVALGRYEYAIFLLRNYRGYINNTSDAALNGVTFAGPVACRVETLRRVGAQQVRRGANKSGGSGIERSKKYRYIDAGGWHFSSLGGPDVCSLKAQSFSHIDDPNRVIRLAGPVPEQQVFRTSLDREQCRELQQRYFAQCPAPQFAPLDYATFNVEEDLPAFLLREKERFRAFFFFTDLV